MAHSPIRRMAVWCAAALASCGGQPAESVRPPAPAESTDVHLLVPPPAQPPETVTVVEDAQLLIDSASGRNGHGPVLRLRTSTGLDTRDLLDGGADLLITDDRSALTYAATLPRFRTVPLDWDRTYVLVAQTPTALGDSQRAELARDAVRIEAQAAAPPYWWNDGHCPSSGTPPPPQAPTGTRIVYAQGDSVARDLAARLVAQRVGGTVALGVSREEFASSLRTGREAAYIFPLSRRPPPDCSTAFTWPASATVVPLIDTRRRAIVREGTVGLSVDADGRLRLEFR
jgi:hypothetical protein